MRGRFTMLLILLAPVSALAQDTVDTQSWLQATATLRLSPDWRLFLEEQPRFSADENGAFQVITRWAVGRQLNPRVSLWGGHAWVAKPPGEGVTHENRIWEQLTARFPDAGRWTPNIRIRVEQRFQDGWENASHRFRAMLRGVRPISSDGRWLVVAWDEVFVTANDSSPGPPQGWDQNRLFGGILRQFSPKLGFEFGYMWQSIYPRDEPTEHAHIAFVWLNLTP